MRRLWQVCLAVVLVVCVPLWANGDLHIQRIRSYLVDPLPDFDAGPYTHLTRVNSYSGDYRQEFQHLVRNDRSVQILANLGREFYEAYLQQLNNDFPASSQNLVIYREREILNRLDQYLQQRDLVSQEQPLTHAQKHARAWGDAINKFGLPPSTPFAHVQEWRSNNFLYSQVMEFYEAEYWRLTNAKTIGRHRQEPAKVTVEDFKKYISAALTEVRIENFRSAARMADAEDRWIVFPQGSDNFSLSAKDLQDAQIEFDLKRHTGAAKIEKVASENLRSSIRSWLKADNWKKEVQWRERLKRIFFDFPKYTLAWSAYRVQFTLKDGRKFYFTEQEFNRLIHEFRTYPKENPFGERRDLRMYLVQAARRDRDLSNLNIQLNHSHDQDFEALRRRIANTSLKVSPGVGSESGVEDLVLRFGREGVRDNVSAHIALAGFMIDPKFWENKSYWNERNLDKPSQIVWTVDRRTLFNSKKIPVVTEFIKGQLQKWFYSELQAGEAPPVQPPSSPQVQPQPVSQPSPRPQVQSAPEVQSAVRVEPSVVADQAPRRRAVSAWRAALLSAAVLAGMNYMTDGWVMNQFSEMASTVQSNLPAQLQLPPLPSIGNFGFGIPGGGGGRQSVDWMAQSQESRNHNLSGGGAGGNGKSQSVYDLNFLRVSPDEIKYINLAANHNLPIDVLADLDPASEPRSVQQVSLSKHLNPHFALRSKIPSYMSSGRIAIAQIPGFELSDLEIYVGRTKIDHYKIYRVPSTGLTYAEIDTRLANGRMYTYQARYTLKTSRPNIDPVLAFIDPKAMKPVLKQLQQDGFAKTHQDLSAWIESGRNTTWAAFTETVAGSAIYSDRAPVKVNARLLESPFVKSAQYLHGGVLHYQCTGTAEFLETAANLYLDNLNVSYRPDLFVQSVSGFVVKEGRVDLDSSHRHTVMGRHSVADSVVELDGTPSVMDPATQRRQEFRPQMNERPQSPEPDFNNAPAPTKANDVKPAAPFLPKASPSPFALNVRAPQLPAYRADKFKFIFDDVDGYKKPEEKAETEDKTETKAETESEKEKVEDEKPEAAQEEKPSLFQRLHDYFLPPPPPKKYIKVKIKQPGINVTLLKGLMEKLQKALEEESKTNLALKKMNLGSTPGLEALGIARAVVEWTEGEQPERQALEMMYRMGYHDNPNFEASERWAAKKTAEMGGEETWVMGSLIHRAADIFKNVSAHLDQEAKTRPSAQQSPMRFLLKPEIARPIDDIFRYLTQLKWDNPPQYVQVEDTSCTEILKK